MREKLFVGPILVKSKHLMNILNIDTVFFILFSRRLTTNVILFLLLFNCMEKRILTQFLCFFFRFQHFSHFFFALLLGKHSNAW